MKNSFHIGGFKVFDGFGEVIVHCLEGNQILVGWFYLQWLSWVGFFREGLDTLLK